jgi:hypothetical protein
MAACSVPDGPGASSQVPGDPAGRVPTAVIEPGPQPGCHGKCAAVIPASLLPIAVLIDLVTRIVDAADDLAAQGYLYDPGDDDPNSTWKIPAETVIELATLATECRECRIGPSGLARHWLNQQEVKYILSQPDWTCCCGASYKVQGEPGRGQDFYTVIDDGKGYAPAGSFSVNSKGKVTHSDPCPACRRPFAEAVSIQNRLPMRNDRPSRNTPRAADPKGFLF